MIGTRIRGIRHLRRLCDDSLRKILVRTQDCGFEIWQVAKYKTNGTSSNESLYLFNPHFSHLDTNHKIIDNILKCHEENGLGRNLRVLELRNGINEYTRIVGSIVLLPKSFDEDYRDFVKKNNKIFKQIEQKYCIEDTESAKLKILYIITNGSKNFFQWAANLKFKHDVSFSAIDNIMVLDECFGHLSNKLSKGTITAYTSRDAIKNLMEEFSKLRNEKRINDTINIFNTSQKKLLKSRELSQKDKEALARFSKLSSRKQTNFVQKVSTIEDADEIMRLMRLVTSVHFDWSKESFMEFIENVDNIKFEKVFENGNVVLIRVDDYETVKQLAKTTNWCISKNKAYWENYAGVRANPTAKQYMIFDFSKKEDDKFSIIGFTTVNDNVILNAHNFVNDNLMEPSERQNKNLIKSYLDKFLSSNNIYDVLNCCGIDINMIAKVKDEKYEWTKEGFFNYLYGCVDKRNVNILCDNGDKVAVSVNDENIPTFLGDRFYDNISEEYVMYDFILFADFSANQYNPSKLTFAIIEDTCDEAYCRGVYDYNCKMVNVEFDSKLIEYKLPYDIIKRCDNTIKRFSEAFCGFNVPVIKQCLEEDPKCFEKALAKYIDKYTINEGVKQVCINFLSFDYLNIIYDSNHTLVELIDFETTSGLVRIFSSALVNEAAFASNGQLERLEKPSVEELEAFREQTFDSIHKQKMIGYYLMLKKMFEHEFIVKSNDRVSVCNPFISLCIADKLVGSMIKELLYVAMKNMDFKHSSACGKHIMEYLIKFGDTEMLDTAHKLAESSEWLKNEFNKHKTSEVLVNAYSC